MRISTRSGMIALTLLAMAGGMVFALPAQPDRAGPATDRTDRPATRADALEPDRLRERLARQLADADRRIEDAREQRDRLAAAIERLDAGDPPGVVVRDLFKQGRVERMSRAGGDRPGQPPAGPRERAPRDIDPDEAIDRLAEFSPELAGRIRRVWAADPELARQIGQRLRPRMRELLELRESDPPLARLRLAEFRAGFEMMLATRKLRLAHINGDDDAIASARTELRAALERTFDTRIAAQRFEIQRLEDKLASVRAELAERETDRASQIDSFMIELDARAAAAEAPDRQRGTRRPGGR